MNVGLKYLKSCHIGREGRFFPSCCRAEPELIWMQILYYGIKLSNNHSQPAKEELPMRQWASQHFQVDQTVQSFVRKPKKIPSKWILGSHASQHTCFTSIHTCTPSEHMQVCMNMERACAYPHPFTLPNNGGKWSYMHQEPGQYTDSRFHQLALH